MGNFNAIYFSPDELKLIKESPDERRRFMDIDLSQFDKNYFYTLHAPLAGGGMSLPLINKIIKKTRN